jgi:hypothetical protein
MSEEQTEHRGWEISDDYHQHWMDDNELDVVDEFEEASATGFTAALIVLAISLAGLYALDLYLAPPRPTFAATFQPPSIASLPPGSIVLPPGTRYITVPSDAQCMLKLQDAKHTMISCYRP